MIFNLRQNGGFFDHFFINAVDIYVYRVKFIFRVYKSFPLINNFTIYELDNTNLANTRQISICCFHIN